MDVSLTSLLGPHRQLKIILVATMLIVIFLIMVWARVFYGSMQAYQKGESYLKEGQYIKAITFFDRSMHWYAPLNPYVQRSAQRLWEISKNARENGDNLLSLIAVRTIRQGFLSARSFYTPGKGWIEKCNFRIQELVMIEEGRNGRKKEGRLDNSVLKEGEEKTPDVIWSIVLLIGLFGWVGSVIAFIISGLKVPQKRSLWGFSTFKWILLGTFFFGVWIVGMVNA